MKLDLACGTLIADGYEGVDSREMGQQFKVDLTVFPWPWEDSSVDALRCSHYVEHCADLIGFMNECHRVLVPGGELWIECPYQHSDAAWQDPTHVRALNLKSWHYYDAQLRAGLGSEYAAITADFEILETVALINPEVAEQYGNEIPPWILHHGVNVIEGMSVLLKKR